MTKPIAVDGVPVDVEWKNYNPLDWRNHPDPDPEGLENDEDVPTPADVRSISGIDTREEGW